MQNKAEDLVYYTAQWVTGTSLSCSGTALSEAPGSDLIDRYEELCVLPRIEVASREKLGLTAHSHTKTDYVQTRTCCRQAELPMHKEPPNYAGDWEGSKADTQSKKRGSCILDAEQLPDARSPTCFSSTVVSEHLIPAPVPSIGWTPRLSQGLKFRTFYPLLHLKTSSGTPCQSDGKPTPQ